MKRRSLIQAGVLLLAGTLPAHADQVPRPEALKFAELARKAETALAQSGPGAAIPLYEEGLAGFPDGYGRIQLRLGQLYQQLGRNAEAAAHYKACVADLRVEALDRELICDDGLKSVTAPVTLTDLPEGAKVVVLEPLAFAGPFASGARLPLGSARLLVEAPHRDRMETTLRITAPAVSWTVVAGAAYTDEENAEPKAAGDTPSSTPGPRRWPLLVGAAGLALVGAGLAVGFLNRDALDGIRRDQTAGKCGADRCRGELDDSKQKALAADVLWMGGTGVTTAGVGLWFLLD